MEKRKLGRPSPRGCTLAEENCFGLQEPSWSDMEPRASGVAVCGRYTTYLPASPATFHSLHSADPQSAPSIGDEL